MRHTTPAWPLGLLAATFAGALGGCARDAQPLPRARDVWSRPSAGPNGVVYMRLLNAGDAPDRLTGARSDVADSVEIHENRMEGNVMRMRPVPEGIPLPAGAAVELQPGGLHLMLIGLKRALKPGDRVQVILQFEISGPLPVDSEVREP